MSLIKSLLLYLIFSVPAYSYIYEIIVLKKRVPSGGSHFIICLSDYHDRVVINNGTQRACIVNHLTKAKDTVYLITEDLCSSNFQGRNGCGTQILKAQGGILAQLSQDLKENGLIVQNVEYRYCRVAGLGQLLAHHANQQEAISNSKSIFIADILYEIEELINYLQGIVSTVGWLHKEYMRTLHSVRTQIAQLKLMEHRYKTVLEYVQMHNDSKKGELLKQLLILDSSLIDLCMMNEIISFNKGKHIILCAGGTHIATVALWLKKYCAYQIVYHLGGDTFKEYNVYKCHPGADIINGTFCVKPYPISNRVLDEVLSLLY